MGDLISRQAAIDALREMGYLVDGYYCEKVEVIDKDDAIETIMTLPSVQPEIIRCKDCKHGVHAGCGNTYLCVVSPENRLEHKYDFWCAYAERRTDE